MLCLQVQWQVPVNNLTILSNTLITDLISSYSCYQWPARKTVANQIATSSYIHLNEYLHSVKCGPLKDYDFQKSTWLYCGGSWWLSPFSKRRHRVFFMYHIALNSMNLLFHTLYIANNQAVFEKNPNCLIIHQYLISENDSRALILL